MKLAAWFAVLVVSVSLRADPDFAAIGKAQQDLDQQTTLENQKIDEAQEQALVPVNAKIRDLRAKAERSFQAASLALVPALTEGRTDIDTSALEAARLAVLEVDNAETNELLPPVLDPFEARRQEVARRHDIAAAKIEARMYDGVEGGEKARDQTIHRAEVRAKWSEKLDALGLERAHAEQKLQREHTTKINRLEARLAGLGAKAAAAQQARLRAKIDKGEVPTAADALPQPDPAAAAVEAERDEARNALQTALDQLRADFTPRQNEIENQRDAELAALGG